MKNRKTEARHHIILAIGVSFCIVFLMFSYYSFVRHGTRHSSAGKNSEILVCLLWDAGLIPKAYIRFWSWQPRTRGSESSPPSKHYSDIFIPSANLTSSQVMGRWPSPYRPTIKGAPWPRESPWRSFACIFLPLVFSFRSRCKGLRVSVCSQALWYSQVISLFQFTAALLWEMWAAHVLLS